MTRLHKSSVFAVCTVLAWLVTGNWVLGYLAVIALIVFAFLGVLTPAAWALGRVQERHRLAADARCQHDALLRGDDLLGVYGRFPPVYRGGIR